MAGQHGADPYRETDDRARMAAEDAARRRGQSLEQYLADLIRDTEHRKAVEAEPARRAGAAGEALRLMTQRIEAMEAKSTLAITGIDQSVIGLVRRLENAERGQDEILTHVDRVIDEVKQTHATLSDQVRQLEADDRAEETLASLSQLEDALGKLAQHVYEENAHAQDESEAIKGRVEAGFAEVNERVGSIEVNIEGRIGDAVKRVESAVEQAELRTEGASRHLSDRFCALEERVARRIEIIDTVGDRMDEVVSRSEASSAKVDDLSERFDVLSSRVSEEAGKTAETLKGLENQQLKSANIAEQQIQQLDRRVDEKLANMEADVSGALGSMEGLLGRVQERLAVAETTTNTALQSLESTFAVLDKKIEGIASKSSPELADELRSQFEQRFNSLASELHANIERTRADMAAEIERAADSVSPEHVSALQAQLDELGNLVTGEAGLSDRLAEMEGRSAGAGAFDADDLANLPSLVEARIAESEQRSAVAIEQVGEQVAGVAERLKQRQQASEDALGETLAAALSERDANLAETLEQMSQRLEEVRAGAGTDFSPVQRAMSSLAHRIELLESGGTAHADDAEPEMVSEFEPREFEPEFASDAFDDQDEAAGFSEVPDAAFTEGLGLDPVSTAETDAASEGVSVPAPELPPEMSVQEALSDFIDDPISELEADDPFGADEVRENEIFDADAPEGDEAEGKLPPAEQAADDIEEDYLARARRAAMAASGQASEPAKKSEKRNKAQKKTKSDTSEAKPKKAKRDKSGNAAEIAPVKARSDEAKSNGRTRPLMLAASVVGLAVAGGAGYVMLKGRSNVPEPAPRPTPTQPSVEAVSADAAQEAVTPATKTETGATPEDALLFDDVDPIAPVETADAMEPTAPPRDTEETVATPSGRPVEPITATETVPVAPVNSVPVAAPSEPTEPGVPQPALTLEAAARGGDPVALYQLGQDRLRTGAIAEGVDMIRRSAETGLAPAQYRLAKLYERGQGLPRDMAEARNWTLRAAENGNVKAMHDTGMFYADGEAGEQSFAKAATWFRRAAEFGVVDSQFNLAVLYEEGLGVSPDMEDALMWFEIALNNGDALAAGKIDALRQRTSLDTAQAAQRRARSFEATAPSMEANGEFGPLPWEATPSVSVSVREIQSGLNALGYDAGPADGVIGSRTRAAIREFQLDQGMAATGEADAVLVQTLRQAAG